MLGRCEVEGVGCCATYRYLQEALMCDALQPVFSFLCCKLRQVAIADAAQPSMHPAAQPPTPKPPSFLPPHHPNPTSKNATILSPPLLPPPPSLPNSHASPPTSPTRPHPPLKSPSRHLLPGLRLPSLPGPRVLPPHMPCFGYGYTPLFRAIHARTRRSALQTHHSATSTWSCRCPSDRV